MNEENKTAAIIGGGGYTAGELIRILLQHPRVQLSEVVSQSQAGKKISDVHADLLGETELVFSDQPSGVSDIVFLCMGHGRSKTFLENHPPHSGQFIIDLSHDFRMAGPDHSFVYGLPEWQKGKIKSARRIANPGCFATAIQLALLPLAAAGQLGPDLHINAITGATGAGQQKSDTTHFSWRNNNVSIYKAFRHQHLAEIRQTIQSLQKEPVEFHFLPMRGNFSRGIFSSIYLKNKMPLEEIKDRYQNFYETHPFVWISEQEPHLKQVVNTNKCLLHLQQIDGKILIISMIDNLLKGASGQAVQNMNLACGWPETMGLRLKAVVF